MILLSEIQWTHAARRIALWRLLREDLVSYRLQKLNTPKYSVKNTTKRQRKDVVSCLEHLFGDEYTDVIKGYVDGKNELSKLKDEIIMRVDEHIEKEQRRREKYDTST